MSSESPAVTGVTPRLVRVERGRASDEELAAVTALLLARAARSSAVGEGEDTGRSPAGWSRLERMRAYRPPHSWQG